MREKEDGEGGEEEEEEVQQLLPGSQRTLEQKRGAHVIPPSALTRLLPNILRRKQKKTEKTRERERG